MKVATYLRTGRGNAVIGYKRPFGGLKFARPPVSGMRREHGKRSRKGSRMTEQARQPKDKNYNLISMLYHSADVVEALKTYVQDAEEEGDQELVDFFSTALENNLEASQRAKELLARRLEGEQE